MSHGTRVLGALVAGLALGAGAAASGSPLAVRVAESVAPIGAVWINAIRMTVVPLIVALLITGVAGAADLRGVGRLGARTLLVFVALLTGMAVVVMPLVPPVFALLPRAGSPPPLPPGAAEAAGEIAATQAPGVTSWLTSLIPTNPVGAAATDSLVSLIVFALIFAVAITQIAARHRAAVLAFFHGVGDAMLVVVRGVIWLAPLGIFALVLPLAARSGLAFAGAVGFYVAVYSVGCLLAVLLLYPVVAVAGGVPIARFARAAFPAQVIAFSSSSSLASLPALVDGAERGLGLAPRVTGFVLPLAVSTFKIAAPVSWTIGAAFIAWFYGVDLGALDLVTVAFAAIFLAFAAPGVPRGAFLMLTPLFLAIGLPPEGIGILIAVDAIPDLFATVLNVTGDLAAAVVVTAGSGERGAAGKAGFGSSR
jgi:Na+/H+-dicarboxylate symporter